MKDYIIVELCEKTYSPKGALMYLLYGISFYVS